MKDPKPVNNKTARQLFICGQIMGIMMSGKHEHLDSGELETLLDQVDVGLLQAYLDGRPEGEGFRYRKQVQEVIKMASARN